MTHVRVDTDFDALARFVSDGLIYVTPEGLVGEWSRGAASIAGIARIDAEGKSLDELFARVEPPLGFAVVPQEMTLWSRDENRREFHVTALSIDNGWLISFGREQRFAAIEQLKNEILAAVSHELKTPIATIKAYATTMRQNPGATLASQDEYLATIEEQADRLNRAVDEMLLAGRVDAPHLLREREPSPMERLLDRVLRELGPTAASRIECRGGGTEINCDAHLLSMALFQIVDNALKFSADGTPVIVEGANNGALASISVADNGIGIGDEHLPYIFERFYRTERNMIAASGGSGLGLYIANSIVRAHGGSIHVESALHVGTRVTIALPVRA
jgi:signal transduction histidine kinase